MTNPRIHHPENGSQVIIRPDGRTKNKLLASIHGAGTNATPWILVLRMATPNSPFVIGDALPGRRGSVARTAVIFDLDRFGPAGTEPYNLTLYAVDPNSGTHLSVIESVDFRITIQRVKGRKKRQGKFIPVIGVGIDYPTGNDSQSRLNVEAFGSVDDVGTNDTAVISVVIAQGANSKSADVIWNDGEGYWYASFPPLSTTGAHTLTAAGNGGGSIVVSGIPIT